MAYNAVRTLATIIVRARGYRIKPTGGGHANVFLALEAALGGTHGPLIAYFDVCRRKRNDLNYDAANVVSDTEADELLRKAHEFRVFVDEWIVKHQPSLA